MKEILQKSTSPVIELDGKLQMAPWVVRACGGMFFFISSIKTYLKKKGQFFLVQKHEKKEKINNNNNKTPQLSVFESVCT